MPGEPTRTSRLGHVAAVLLLGCTLSVCAEQAWKSWKRKSTAEAVQADERSRLDRIVTSLRRGERSDQPVSLGRADLRGAQLARVHLDWADLDRANLEGANLVAADLEGAFLVSANLSRAQLRAANLQGALLRGSRLERAQLGHADLRDARLVQADLRAADLRDADLRHATLARARLGAADLRGADLTGADLRGADFTDARLDGALMPRALITGTKLDRATGLSKTALQDTVREPLIEGAVVDIDGKLAVGAEVAYGDPPDWTASVLTDAAGHYAFVQLPEGRQWLSVRRADTRTRRGANQAYVTSQASYNAYPLRLPDPRSHEPRVGLPLELRLEVPKPWLPYDSGMQASRSEIGEQVGNRRGARRGQRRGIGGELEVAEDAGAVGAVEDAGEQDHLAAAARADEQVVAEGTAHQVSPAGAGPSWQTRARGGVLRTVVRR